MVGRKGGGGAKCLLEGKDGASHAVILFRRRGVAGARKITELGQEVLGRCCVNVGIIASGGCLGCW